MSNAFNSISKRCYKRSQKASPVLRMHLGVEQLESRNLLTIVPGLAAGARPLDFELVAPHHEMPKLTLRFQSYRDPHESHGGQINRQSFDNRSDPKKHDMKHDGRPAPIPRLPRDQVQRSPSLISPITQRIGSLAVTPPLRLTTIEPNLRTPELSTNQTPGPKQIQFTALSKQPSPTRPVDFTESLRFATPKPPTSTSNDVVSVSFQPVRPLSNSAGIELARVVAGSVPMESAIAELTSAVWMPATNAEVAAMETTSSSGDSAVERFGGFVDLPRRRELQFTFPANDPTVRLDVELSSRGSGDNDVIEELLQLDLSELDSEISDHGNDAISDDDPTDRFFLTDGDELSEETLATDDAKSNDAVFANWEASDDSGGMIDLGTYAEAQQGDQNVARYHDNFTRDDLWSVNLKLEPTVGDSQVFEFIDAETIPAEVPVDQAAENADQHLDIVPLAAPEDGSLTQAAACVSPFVAVIVHRWKKNQNPRCGVQTARRKPSGIARQRFAATQRPILCGRTPDGARGAANKQAFVGYAFALEPPLSCASRE